MALNPKKRIEAHNLNGARPFRAPLQDQNTKCSPEEYFHHMLTLERKRSERSGKPIHLMLVDIENIPDADIKRRLVASTISTISEVTRETDIKGWYRQDVLLGVIFTETNGVDVEVLRCKVIGKLSALVPEREGSRVIVSFHVFPADKGDQRSLPPADLTWYPDIPTQKRSRRGAALLKRMMDVAGSVAGILIFSPVFIAVSLLVKLTSRGPVLFRQERVGQYGKRFTFLKFRTMYTGNDQNVHREYIRKLIEGNVDGNESKSGEQRVFKITDDKRITPVGGLLRKTSMDELPQFFNVLRGEMSLVGPRPPIPYEVDQYDIWHRRRVMEIKPGITGLWQVKGRSSTTFDDMVRLDLQYAKEWSIWLDIKILLKTPWAVLRGKGAY